MTQLAAASPQKKVNATQKISSSFVQEKRRLRPSSRDIPPSCSRPLSRATELYFTITTSLLRNDMFFVVRRQVLRSSSRDHARRRAMQVHDMQCSKTGSRGREQHPQHAHKAKLSRSPTSASVLQHVTLRRKDKPFHSFEKKKSMGHATSLHGDSSGLHAVIPRVHRTEMYLLPSAVDSTEERLLKGAHPPSYPNASAFW